MQQLGGVPKALVWKIVGVLLGMNGKDSSVSVSASERSTTPRVKVE
jgi:hypothetical protein